MSYLNDLNVILKYSIWSGLIFREASNLPFIKKIIYVDFLKIGPSPASFSFIFGLLNKHYNFYNIMWINVLPVSGAGIRTHNLFP